MCVCMKKPRKSAGLVAEDSSSCAVRRLQKLLTLLDGESRPHGSDPLGQSPKRAFFRLFVCLLVRARYDVGGDEFGACQGPGLAPNLPYLATSLLTRDPTLC